MSEKILVIGANGQIGTELVTALRDIHGAEQVIASDINSPTYAIRHSGPFEFVNVLELVKRSMPRFSAARSTLSRARRAAFCSASR